MIIETNAKAILSRNKQPSSWFGVKYTMNIYRGCEHKCIYCDSRSECYRIENFDDIIVKVNAVQLLEAELKKMRIKGTVGTGAMSDPYTFAEKKYRLMGSALEKIAQYRFPVHITTKSSLILRDIDALCEINKVFAQVAFTITTTDDMLAKKIEPFAPSPTERLKAMGILSALNVCTGITMMPILPFIEDSEKNIVEIVKKAKEYGARFIYPNFGMTLRDRQKDYYFKKLDEEFPGIRNRYEKRYGIRYNCRVPNSITLERVFREACEKYGVSTKIPTYDAMVTQISLDMLQKNSFSKV